MEEQNVLLLFIISLGIIFLTQKLIRIKVNLKHPPSPPSLPIIGHLHHLKKPVHRTLLDVMTRITAGKRYYGEDAGDAEEAKAFQEMIEEVFKYAGTAYPGDFLPVLRWIGYQGFEKRACELGKTMDGFLQGLADEHRQKKKKEEVESEEKKEKSMIEHLLSLQASDPEFAQAILFAGIDTPASTMEWAFANLLNHPTILKKAKAEIYSQIGQCRLIDELDLSRLPYLLNIIPETLRLYPPAPLLLPHCSSDDSIIGGFSVPRGTVVLVNAWAIHRESEQWSDPTSFMPERFESGEDKVNRLTLPFWVGEESMPRCIVGS